MGTTGRQLRRRVISSQDDVSIVDDQPTNLGRGWRWSSVYADRYEFEAELDVPDGFSGECHVRFFWARSGATDHHSRLLSVLIPGGIDHRPHDTAGRAIIRTVRP